jgi:hypothetical protein
VLVRQRNDETVELLGLELLAEGVKAVGVSRHSAFL